MDDPLLRRIGTPPKEREGVDRSLDAYTCPDLFVTRDENIVVVGTDITDDVSGLPEDRPLMHGERVIAIPRSVVLDAIYDLDGRMT